MFLWRNNEHFPYIIIKYPSYLFHSSQMVSDFHSELSKLTEQTCEPGHEKICLMSYANNKGADQPAHLQ